MYLSKIDFNLAMWSLVLLFCGGCDSNQSSKTEAQARVEATIGTINNSPWLYFGTEKSVELNSQGKYSDGYKIGQWSYAFEVSGDKRYVEWTVHNQNGIKLNYPSNWEVEAKPKAVFFADIPSRPRSYFGILSKGDTVASTASEYLNMLYSVAAIDTSELLSSKSARWFKPKIGSDFFIYEFILLDKEQRWLALGMIRKHEGSIIDVGLRITVETAMDEALAKFIFTDIIDGLRIDDRSFGAALSNLEKVQTVTFN
jgi:hypothetical protein